MTWRTLSKGRMTRRISAMKEKHTAEETRAHFRDVIRESESCVLCLGDIDTEEENRGIIEFVDGWFWICSKCRKVVAGTLLDMTQSEDWGRQDVIPYYKRSRKRWLKYLEKECQIIIIGDIPERMANGE